MLLGLIANISNRDNGAGGDVLRRNPHEHG